MSNGSKNQVLCLRQAFNITEILHEYSAVITLIESMTTELASVRIKLY